MLRDVKTVILLVGLVLKCVLGENQTENSIIIMTPHVWVCDQYATQTMLIDTVSDKLKAENVNVIVTLKSRSDSSNVAFNVRETVRANSNGFHRFDFELPDRIEHGFYDVEVNVIGDDGYSFNGSLANLECRNSQNGIYIITDKPVYKDSEKVRIRVVNIDSNLLPVSDETASIYIMDPNKNRVQQFLDVEFTNGLIDGLEFKLTDRPIYGDWEIKVAFNDTEKSINFNVKEYVLPKFDFKLNLPDYIIRTSKEIKGSVEAKYTYGKPLDGDVKVRLENLFYGPYVVNNQTSYQSGTVVQYEQVYILNKGKIDFTLPFKASDYSYNYKVNVTVTDKYSDESSSKESMLNILWNEFYARLDNYDFNPNQTNYLKVDLVQPNEKPYAFKKINVTIMQKSVDYSSVSYNYKSLSNDSFFLTSDVNGRLNFSFFVEPNVTNIEITLVSGDDSSQIAYVYLYKRIENQIQPPTPIEKLIIRPETNDTLELDTQLALKLIRNDTGENCVNARYFVLGKLQILMDSVIELCEETTIYIELGAQYAPYSTVVVYYVDSITKNVTVASYEIKIDNFFRNHLEIAFSSNTTQPGEDVEIELYTRENSLVSLCIIDKSVELLRQPNELTINDINSQMLSTRLYGYYPPYPSSSSNVNQFGRMVFPRPGYWQLTESLRKLHNQGLIVASDLEDLFANFTEFQGPIVPLADGPINAPPALAQDEAATSTANFGGSGEAAAAARPQGAAAVVPRSNFQETWIWDTYDVKNSTQKFIYSKIPDTITSWVASGFSINSEYGLAIANKTSITTFKNFFVSMILPPSLVRGEILHLQVVVYNYFDHDLKNVLVVLSKTDDFKEANGSRLFNITSDLEVTIPLIESQNAQTVEFLISPVNIGQLPLTVKAVSDEAGDGETRKLKVKAEGIEQASTQALLIELDNSTALTHDFHIDLPANIVKDSEFCSIQVIGDLLGPSLNNLNRLVSKPYGCGEQNMVTLTPNIYALNYLYAIADPNSPSKNKISNADKLIIDAKSNILFGFQNQLKYVLDDGSFSAFGKSDVNGSTWLTSFVVKSFAQARKYAPEIDNRVIQKAVKFLIEQQKPNGAFAENGRVIHSDMQGGVSSEQTITAYVAIALIESQLIDEITTESIKSALTYLEREAPKIKDQDAYALGIVTYALTLGNSDDAKKYYELFQSKSIRSSDGNINWSKNPNNPEASSDVELTSYGLLLTLLRNDLSTSLSIVKYLVGKSSSLGSYSNTQDTVLALQALSQFGIRSSESAGSGTKSVDITTSLIDSSSNTLASKTFKTTEENSIVLQTWDLPSCRAKVSLNAQGSGTALFQLIASYNIPKNPVKPVFTIRQNTTKSATNSVNIKTCATYNKDSTTAKSESTGMTLIEATLLSGYEANKQELDGLVGNVKYLKLVEIKDQQVVVFYLDQLDDSNELCVEWKMHKVNDVDNLQAVPVKVYDYYQSNLEYSILFSPPSN